MENYKRAINNINDAICEIENMIRTIEKIEDYNRAEAVKQSSSKINGNNEQHKTKSYEIIDYCI